MASFLHVGFFYTTVLLGGIRLTWAFIMVPISRIPLDRRYGAHLLQRWASDVDSGPQSLGIVGGGLAGLATTFYALQQQLLDENPNSSHLQTITVWDRHAVGTGGASAVAGGYVDHGACVWRYRLEGKDQEYRLLPTTQLVVSDYITIFATPH